MRTRSLSILLALGASLVPPAALAQEPKQGHAQAGGHEPHWAYADGPGTVGPEHWGTLPGDTTCAIGKNQSPIDFQSKGRGGKELAPLTFDYHASALRMVDNGHTVQVDVDAGSLAKAGGQSYKLAQFHFHAPSEHTIDGHHAPLELHLVHLDSTGKPALVVGVLVREGRSNDALDAAFRQLPKHVGETAAPVGARVEPARLLPASRASFHYSGSLTTPPCSEGISWYVMESPIEMSKTQIEAFTSIEGLGASHRPVQQLGNRTVERTAPH